MSTFEWVLFVCEDMTIQKTIKKSIDYLGVPELLGKIVFVNASDWKTSATTAPLNLKSGVINFSTMCKQKAA